MLGIPCELIVVVVIVLVAGQVLLILNEAHKLWDVHFLAEIFDVQAQVDNHLLTVIGITVADQE